MRKLQKKKLIMVAERLSDVALALADAKPTLDELNNAFRKAGRLLRRTRI
jgi:hypothetical protein